MIYHSKARGLLSWGYAALLIKLLFNSEKPNQMSKSKSTSKAVESKQAFQPTGPQSTSRTLDNSTTDVARAQVSDLKIWGEDAWKLISKASSKRGGWFKSTKAMEVPTGCFIQVTTYEDGQIAEAVAFAPGLKIVAIKDEDGNIVGRKFK
tara:strand:+ start:4245 stop:4694 length:450 start_codon:yes stop_codon:yes gene_type:complete